MTDRTNRPPRAVAGATWRWGGNGVWQSWDLMVDGKRVGWVGEADLTTWTAVLQGDGGDGTTIAGGTKAACAAALGKRRKG